MTCGLLAGRLMVEAGVARAHLAITVELVHGVHTRDLWPRPGRVLIAARTATFEQLGKAIDDAFARWDHNHLHEFTLADGTVIIPARWWDGEEPQRSVDGAKARLGRLRPAERFRLHLRPGRQPAAPVHHRPAAGRPAGDARDHPRQAAALSLVPRDRISCDAHRTEGNAYEQRPGRLARS